jgi:hypothetical protein
MDLTLLSLWIHIPIVTTWIGMVMLDVYASSVPGLAPQQRGRMIAWFRPFVIVAILVILATGIWQTMRNPFTEVDSWSTLQELKDSTYGFSLFIKHGFVLATFLLTLIVTFIYAPRLMATPAAATTSGAQVPGVPGAKPPSGGGWGTARVPQFKLERIIRWLSVLNLIACLGALIMATRMVWELH